MTVIKISKMSYYKTNQYKRSKNRQIIITKIKKLSIRIDGLLNGL